MTPVGSRIRYLLAPALVFSFALHALFVLGLSGVRFLIAPPPMPIEILPFKAHPPAPPTLEPPAERPQKPKASDGVSRPTKTPQKPTTPGIGKAPAVQDLRAVGPSGANITIVLRGPLLAKSPHREAVDQLLSMLPDYHTLLDGTGLHPFDDLDAILIATPDPRDVSATFLAARYRGDPRIRALDGKALGGGDTRRILALGADLMLLGRPEDLARIEAAEADPKAEAEGARWLASLRHFDDTSKGAALLLTIADLPALIRMRGDLPLPHMVRLALSAEASPATRLLCGFDDEATAIRFWSMWPEVKTQVRESAPMFGGIFDQLTITRRDKDVELEGHLPETQVRMLLALANMFGPRAPAPAAPPPDLAEPDRDDLR